MRDFVRRTGIRLKDAVRYSDALGAAWLTWLLARTALARSPAARMAPLFRAYRFTWREGWLRRLRWRMARLDPWPAEAARWELFHNWPQAPQGTGRFTRSLLLKAPGPGGERGVLLLTAEYNWLRLFADPAAAAHVAARYDLVVSAGWSATDHLLLAHGLRVFPGRIFVEPANHAEGPKLAALDPRVVVLPTICCDWIDPARACPTPRAGRPTDLLMVANWAPFKRHWHLFAALRHLPRGLAVTVVGQPDGPHTLARVRAEAAVFGAADRVEFLENLPAAEVMRRQAAAKAFVILSRHEGCCVSVVEALSADTPVGMLADAHIGPRAYINPQTGVLLPHQPRRLAAALADLVARTAGFSPRKWFEQHISCHRSLAKLTVTLRDRAAADGRPWTVDPAPFCWAPYCGLLEPADADRLRPALDELTASFPGLFGPGQLAVATAAR